MVRKVSEGDTSCVGVAVPIVITPKALAVILEAAPEFAERVWDNHVTDYGEDKHPGFVMCTGHWMSLTAAVGYSGTITSDAVKLSLAGALLVDFSRLSGLDYKELTNYIKSLADAHHDE